MNAARLGKLRGVYPLADDDPRWRHDPRAVVEAVLAAGVSVLQLRTKQLRDADVLELATWATKAAHAADALLIVNDRFDLADLAGADGVHLGQDDLPPERIPAEVRARLLVGLSTHTHEQMRASAARPIDYVAFGPVFGTASKTSEYDPRGLAALAEAAKLARHPLVAIGGIDAGNIGAVRKAGAAAGAVISAIAGADDPVAATRYLVDRFGPPASS